MSQGQGLAPAAIGYTQYDWAKDDWFNAGWLERSRCNSVAEFISETNSLVNFECSKGIRYKRNGVPEVRQLAKNQDLKFQNMEYTIEEFLPGEQWYWATKWDEQDEACGHIQELLGRYLNELELVWARKIDQSVFREIEKNKACHMSGTGLCGSDVGSCTNPLQLNCRTIFKFFVDIEHRLTVDCKGNGRGRPYVVLPRCAKYPLLFSPEVGPIAKEGACITDCMLLDGTTLGGVYGVDIIFSDDLPTKMINGEEVTFVPFGYRDAVKLGRGFETARFGVEDVRSAGKISYIKKRWGTWLPEPEYVGGAYIVIDTNTDDCKACC